MSDGFSQWTARIDDAAEDGARRALLAEIGIWRVRNLSDLTAQREAAYAIATLYAALGEAEPGLREAQNLMSLCRTPPSVDAAALGQAQRLVRSLGGEPGPAPRERAHREPRAPREARPDPRRSDDGGRPAVGALGAAIQAGLNSDWSDAFKALRGKNGPRAEMVRTWLDLRRSLEETDEERLKRVHAVVNRLDKHLDVRSTPSRNDDDTPSRELIPGSLEALIGRPLPGRRDKRLRIVDRFLNDQPQMIDEVASVALRDHVTHAGPQQPAPWLVRYTALAMATGGTQIEQTVAELQEQGAFAVSAYAEPPFRALVNLVTDLLNAGALITDLRRGVQREEPAERRLWTLRAHMPGHAEVMIVIAPDSSAPYTEGMAASLAKRIRHLSDNAVLNATGEGNAALRETASVLGVQVATTDLVATVVERVRRAPAISRAREQPTASQAAPSAPPQDKPSRPATPSLADLISSAQAILHVQPIDHDALMNAVGPIRKVRDLFALVRDPLDETRLVALLKALHQVVPPDIRLLEGTTLALRVAADPSATGAAAAVLTDGDDAQRYGGEGMHMVLPVAIAAQRDGWQLFRVLRGVTRRERREHAVVEPLAEYVADLWRLLLRKDDERAELWVVGTLAPEGRAVLPHLLLDERKRVAVLPLDADVLASWREIGGPEPIGWTGDTEEVVQALR